MSSGVQPIIDYLNAAKDVQKMIGKYSVIISTLEFSVKSQEGVHVTLNHKIDKYGEFISKSFIETLREITTECITELRSNDSIPIDREDYWKV